MAETDRCAECHSSRQHRMDCSRAPWNRAVAGATKKEGVTPFHLYLAPDEAARLAATAPGAAVTVRCGEPLPDLPDGYVWECDGDGAISVHPAGAADSTDDRSWSLGQYRHPAPAPGTEVWAECPAECDGSGVTFDGGDGFCGTCGVLRATVTARGAAPYCEACAGEGGAFDSSPGGSDWLDCGACHGSPPWWPTVTLTSAPADGE